MLLAASQGAGGQGERSTFGLFILPAYVPEALHTPCFWTPVCRGWEMGLEPLSIEALEAEAEGAVRGDLSESVG